ncbi:MAG: KH domain-containing protein [Caldilineae bacterium]|nr:MAG: KH domain-containing protein [Caldilineae bacterium]
MEKLVEFLAASLVEDPDAVRVSSRSYRDRIILRLRVAPEDTGRVIGKGGRVANAIRSVLRVAALPEDREAVLKIM